MAYLGNAPATAYSTVSYQDLTGGTGTSFTLDHSIANENEIEVFVNNVRQEPSVAYTASGTTLTMTGSIASTDDFYVVFQGKAQQTVSHPAGNSLTAVNGTFTGNLTVDTNTLYVDSTNNKIGVGTTSLASGLSGFAQLEVSGTNGGIIINSSDTGVTDYGRLLFTKGNSSGNEGLIRYNTNDYHMSFWTDATERMRISSGNLLVGKTDTTPYTAGSMFKSDGEATLSRDNDTLTIFTDINTANTGSGKGAVLFKRGTTGTLVGYISTTTSSTSYVTSSDYRLKENVVDMTGATERLKQLNPVRFNFIADADTTVDGFLAHEVQDIVPEAITGTKDEVDADGNAVYQGIDQSKLVPLLVATIQELEARIAALESN